MLWVLVGAEACDDVGLGGGGGGGLLMFGEWMELVRSQVCVLGC